MHTIRLNIHDSIYEKLMGLLEILPKDKVEITEEYADFPTITFEDAQQKVQKAINNMETEQGVPLSQAIDSIVRS